MLDWRSSPFAQFSVNVMRILFVSPMPPDPHGGGAIPVLLHAELSALREHHEVTLVTVAGPDESEWDALERVEQSGIEVLAVRRSNPPGFDRWKRRWRFGSRWLVSGHPWRTVWFSEPGVQRIIDRILAHRPYDLIHAEDNAVAFYDLPERIPKLLTEVEVRRPRPIQWNGQRQSGSLRWALSEADWRRWRRYQSKMWRRFDRIQVFTERDAAHASMIDPFISDRVVVNPFPIEVPSVTSDRMEDPNVLLFVGNYTHPPNVDAALWLGTEIMPALWSARPDTHLVLAGGHPPDEVRALANEHVTVSGYVRDIESLFERAAVVMAPVRIGGGMRMKVLQAMALGKAVVTTTRGTEGLAINGYQPPVVVADDTQHIADATLSLLADAERRLSLGRQAHSFALTHHSPHAYMQRLDAIYADLISSR